MPSSLSQRVSRAFSISSRSSSSVQSEQSISSDLPSGQSPTKMEVMVEENDELDLEDQAWGSPPSTNLLPKFLRKRN